MAIKQGAGWTCEVCGGWVPIGWIHNCPRPNHPSTDADRIVAAIDRLTAAIERLGSQEVTIETVPPTREDVLRAARTLGIGLAEAAR